MNTPSNILSLPAPVSILYVFSKDTEIEKETPINHLSRSL